MDKGYIDNFIDETVELLKKNKHPLQVRNDDPSYCMNPVNNQVYRGINQMALQQTNVINENPFINHVSLHEMNMKKLRSENKKVKCTVLYAGVDEKGNKKYVVTVPVKPLSRRQQREEDKLDKLADKLAARLVLKGQEEKPQTQTPLIEKKKEIPLSQAKQKSLDKKIHNHLAAEMDNYYDCILAKVPYTPVINWKDKQTKEAIIDWVNKNGDKFIEIMDRTYSQKKNQGQGKEVSQGLEKTQEKTVTARKTTQPKVKVSIANGAKTTSKTVVNTNTAEQTKGRGRKM